MDRLFAQNTIPNVSGVEPMNDMEIARRQAYTAEAIIESIPHEGLQALGYTHTKTNEFGLGGTRDHHFTHPEPITKEHIKNLHNYLSPLGYRKEKGGGMNQTSWKKGSHDFAFITRSWSGKGHTLQVAEPK